MGTNTIAALQAAIVDVSHLQRREFSARAQNVGNSDFERGLETAHIVTNKPLALAPVNTATAGRILQATTEEI
jgi:hypothetical protein